MRKLILAVALIGMASAAMAEPVRVRGYIRSDGTYVAPHVRSAPNNSTADNWSTSPNVNPYTGQEGRREAVPTYRPYTPPRAAPPMTPNPHKTPCYYNCK